MTSEQQHQQQYLLPVGQGFGPSPYAGKRQIPASTGIPVIAVIVAIAVVLAVSAVVWGETSSDVVEVAPASFTIHPHSVTPPAGVSI